MSEAPDLERLAGVWGIESAYWDIFGTLHETSPDSQRALLAAMGCDVSSDTSISREIHAAETRPWRHRLPPVRVIRSGSAPGEVEINLPARSSARPMRWRLVLEGGGQLGDIFLPESMPHVAAKRVDGADIHRIRLALPRSLAEGYHQLHVEDGDCDASCGVIVAPPAAYRPPWMDEGRRQWGWACHLYSLRSDPNWGIGDFSDLEALAAVSHGAAILGVNPLHSLFAARPEEASPYSPSSRGFVNPLYIDVTAVPEFAACEAARNLVASPAFAADLVAARQSAATDYTRVARIKMTVLGSLHADFAARRSGGREPDARRRAFDRFVEAGGAALQRYALFEALQEHFDGKPWRTWPAPFRTPEGAAAAAFARDHAARVEFFAYLQWVADTQLGAAAARCANAGMAVGLYRDLAVGANPDGADVWSDQAFYAHGARVGAPPDAFNAQGQDWGLPPLHPANLRQAAYEPFIRLVRANMRHAGALRIDHAMAVQHQFWLVPGEGAPPGAYVTYPIDDLLGILALESKRNRCVLIGEDLGTVPEGFRERMAAEAILSYRVLFFERYPDGLYRRPDTYPAQSVAVALTHDMPTIAGFWQARDLRQRREIGLLPDDAAWRAETARREADKAKLIAALRDQGLLPDPHEGDSASPDLPSLVAAVERFLARTPSCIMLANIDDVALEPDQLNMPGTVFEYPNWRRKLSIGLEAFARDGFVSRIAEMIAAERERVTR